MTVLGYCDQRFAAVKEAFARSFADGLERGARFSVVIDDQVVVDLMGGVMDRDGQKPFGADTLCPIFSTGKAINATLIARLVDQKKISYDTPVAAYLPDFAKAGKAAVTVGQLISHQGGLSGFNPPREPTLWYDQDATFAALCEQAPMWPLGTGSGYHPITGGYVLNALHKAVDGRTLGQALRQDFAEPFGFDLFIGTPESEFSRIADLVKPTALPELGPLDDIKRAAFMDKGSAPAGRASSEWRKIEIPSANAHGTALSLARFMGIMANGGTLKGTRLIGAETLHEATKERVFGPDKVLPFTLSWGAGFLRNKGINIYGNNPDAVGHSGWGGSCALADPARRLSAAYVMNKQSNYLLGDPRPLALLKALYSCL